MNEISRKILCVDDEISVLEGLRRQLRKKFDITIALGGKQGMACLHQDGPFAVVMSDYEMPEMNGIAFLQQVHEASQESVLVMLTGRSDLEVAVSALHDGHIYRFLNKPCSREQLEKTIQDCLEQYRLVISERNLSAELTSANLELGRLNEKLEKRVEERTAAIQNLYRFVSDLNGLDTIDDVSSLVVRTTAKLLRSGRVSLMMPDGDRDNLTIRAAVGIPDDVKERVRVPIGSPIAGHAFAESRSIIVNDVSELPLRRERYDTDFFAIFPLACASLATPSGPIGVLNVTDRLDGTAYDEESLACLEAIAEAAAIAIRNQIRLKERNEARDATILALANLAEHRDPETGAHLERVQIYCRVLSEALAQTPKYASVIDHHFIDTIVRSSPLHDIGKVGIPDHILQKPGPLTPEAFEVMKEHSKIGGDTIRALVNKGRRQAFLQMGMDIAYYHHEKFNGSGYPHGISGKEIPLPARILAVADAYDALTSRRVYKPAMPHEKAVMIIREDSGSHFDPDVVAAFLSNEKAFRRLSVQLGDVQSESAKEDDGKNRSAGVERVPSGIAC